MGDSNYVLNGVQDGCTHKYLFINDNRLVSDSRQQRRLTSVNERENRKRPKYHIQHDSGHENILIVIIVYNLTFI